MKTFKPIIESLLDVDFYKFLMGNIAFERHRNAVVEYKFQCRKPDVRFGHIFSEVEKQINNLGNLYFQPAELDYLSSLGCLSPQYIEFLRDVQLTPEHEVIMNIDRDGNLQLRVKGKWPVVIFYETLILSIISECYGRAFFQDKGAAVLAHQLLDDQEKKIQFLKEHAPKDFQFFDFGTRRRLSRHSHYMFVESFLLEVPEYFRGTSNTYLSWLMGTRPVGTMAHEYLQAYQAIASDLKMFQFRALLDWDGMFETNRKIALTDVVGVDAFLKDFDYSLCNSYAGVRQDSGDPYVWCEMIIGHYEKMGIDPKTKVAVFSDGLNIAKAIELHNKFNDRIKCQFGIGTYLTNQTEAALPMVIKLVSFNGKPVAKISDSPGKCMCEDAKYLAELRSLFPYPDEDYGN